MKTIIAIWFILVAGISIASAQEPASIQPTTFKVQVQGKKTVGDKGTKLVTCFSIGKTLTVCTKN